MFIITYKELIVAVSQPNTLIVCTLRYIMSRQITAEMFAQDSGSVKETTASELLAKIIELSQNDPHDFKLSGQRVNLMLIRRMATKLSRL